MGQKQVNFVRPPWIVNNTYQFRHYLYRHIRPDTGFPFYIGVGTKRIRSINPSFTSEYERAFSKRNRPPLWMDLVGSISENIIVEIIFESNDHSEILEKEKEFIRIYGRVDENTGTLVNRTSGGQGSSNYIASLETRQKISSSLKALKMTRSPETREKISIANSGKSKPSKLRPPKQPKKTLFGRKPTPESIQKRLISMKGYKHSEETKRKISESNKGKKVSEETRKKQSEWKRKPTSLETKLKLSLARIGKPGKIPSEATREKMRSSHLGKKASMETRAKMSKSRKGKVHSEESKRKIGEIVKDRWQRIKQQHNP